MIKDTINIIKLLYTITWELFLFKLNNLLNYLTNKPKIERLVLIKNLTHKLESMNILYIKVFQSLCLENQILNEDEQNYLIKYIDNVPYNSDSIDYTYLDILNKEYNIHLENELLNNNTNHSLINSGIVGVVFKGFQNNIDNRLVIKILKNNISHDLHNVYNELMIIAKIISYLPYLKNFNIYRMLNDNKNILLNQTNFLSEVTNLEIFKEKYANMPQFRIPHVYREITEKYNNIIVMENIEGLKINNIKKYNNEIKEEFAKLILEFGYISVLYNSACHCDLHAGNIFFYMNNENINVNVNENSYETNLPKYQLGIIDFGICSYPSKESQNHYYNFFNDIQLKNEVNQVNEVNEVNILDYFKYFIDPKDKLNNLTYYEVLILNKQFNNIIEDFRLKNNVYEFFYNINKLLKKYDLYLSSQFNKIVLSISIANSLVNNLTTNSRDLENEVFEKFVAMNNLFSINE